MLLADYVFPAVLIGVPAEEPFLLTHNNSHPHTKAWKHTHTPITQLHTYKHTPTHTQAHTHTHTHTYRQGPPSSNTITETQTNLHVQCSHTICVLYVSHPANTHTPRKKSIDVWV